MSILVQVFAGVGAGGASAVIGTGAWLALVLAHGLAPWVGAE